jgi:integrase
MRAYFKAAAAAIGMPELRLHHDLRHIDAQLASDAGAPTAQVQVALRHANPIMSRRYEIRQAREEMALLVGRALAPRRAG